MINSITADVPQYILFGFAASSLVLAVTIRRANVRAKGVPSEGKRTAPAKKRSKVKTTTTYRPLPVRSFVPMHTQDR